MRSIPEEHCALTMKRMTPKRDEWCWRRCVEFRCQLWKQLDDIGEVAPEELYDVVRTAEMLK
jgi:hypothetical protein